MPKVSIVIPCFNLGQYLDEAVDSVLAQSFQNFEIIIVDDGSTDEFTNELLAKYDKPKTKVLRQENHGLPGARNSGIKASSGEYMLCLDADDKIHPEYLEKAVQLLDSDFEHVYGFVMPWVQLFGAKDRIWRTTEFDPYILGMQHGMHATALFRKECWKAAGGYREQMSSGYEDWDFWISVLEVGYKWVTLKEPLFYYRKRAASMLTKSDEQRLFLFRQIIRNHKDFYRNNYEDIIVRGLENYEAKLRICGADLAANLELINTQSQHQIELEAECHNLRLQISTLTEDLEALRSSFSLCDADRAAALEVINAQGQRQIELEAECQKLHLQINNLTENLKEFRSSLSWRITAPFRATLALLRRFKS